MIDRRVYYVLILAALACLPLSGCGGGSGETTSHQVVLEWDASSSQVIGYNPYRGTVTGGPYTKLTLSPIPQTSYPDHNVEAGQTYFYVVTAVGTDGVESAFSNEAEATVPTP